MARQIKKLPGRPFALSGAERKGKKEKRLAQYYQEHQQNQAVEKELSKLNQFDYQPVDYAPQLVRRVRTEPPVPDFSHLLSEAQLKISSQYFQPIAMHVGVVVAIIFVSFLNSTEYSLILALVGVVCICFSFQRLLSNREKNLANGLTLAKNRINAKLQEFQETNQRGKDQFEKKEDNRINKLEELLHGERSAMIQKIDDVISGMRVPFPCQCTTHLYDQENPVIFIELPPVSIIPTTTSDIIASGEVEYEAKVPIHINKQYVEAVTGIGIQIALVLHSQLPSLKGLFLCGVLKEEQKDDFLYSVMVSKEAAAEAVQYRSGLQYLNKLEAQINLKHDLKFVPIKPKFPEWWETVRLAQIDSFNSVCLNMAANGADQTGILLNG